MISKENPCHLLEEAQELSKRRNWKSQTQNSTGLSWEHLKDFSGHHKNREVHLQFKCSQKPWEGSDCKPWCSSPNGYFEIETKIMSHPLSQSIGTFPLDQVFQKASELLPVKGVPPLEVEVDKLHRSIFFLVKTCDFQVRPWFWGINQNIWWYFVYPVSYKANTFQIWNT